MVRGSVFGSENQARCFERGSWMGDRHPASAPVTARVTIRGWDKLTALHSRWRRSDSNKAMQHFTHTKIHNNAPVVVTSVKLMTPLGEHHTEKKTQEINSDIQQNNSESEDEVTCTRPTVYK